MGLEAERCAFCGVIRSAEPGPCGACGRTPRDLTALLSAVAAVAVIVMLYCVATHSMQRSAVPVVADGVEGREYQEFISKVNGAFRASLWDELDHLLTEVRTDRARFSWGPSKLAEAYNQGIKTPPSDVAGTVAAVEKCRSWVQARPRSVAALSALALSLVQYAWLARGYSYAQDVPEGAWPLFTARLKEAHAAFDRAVQLDPQAIDPYLAGVSIGLGEAWPVPQYTAYCERGLAIWPGEPFLYGALAEFLLPRWFGGERDLEQMAATAAGKDGDAIYALIAVRVSAYYEPRTFLKSTGFSWRRLKSGFEDLTGDHPASALIAGQYAYFAVEAGDKDAARACFVRLGKNQGWAKLGTGAALAATRAWALAK